MPRRRRKRFEAPEPLAATLRVRGEGFAEVAADAARVNVGIVVVDPALTAARDAAAFQGAAIIAAAKDAGIPPIDLQTSEYRIRPLYRRDHANGEPQAIDGYEVRNTVSVTVRDLERLPAVLDGAAEAGANEIHGPEFFVQRPDTVEDDARRGAMASARRRAEALAAAEGLALGRVLSIVEGEARHAPTPRTAMKAMADAAPGTPIEAGVQRFVATVEVTWELDASGSPPTK